MKIGRQLWVSGYAVAAMLALAAGALLQSDKRVFAVRWDLHGQPYGYVDAWIAILIVPLVAVALTALFASAPRLLPTESLDKATHVWTALWTSTLIALCAGQAALVALNLGVLVNTPRLAAFTVAVVFAVIGNYMGKLRYNSIIGLRLPWTKANERVWDKSHRFLGRGMVAGAVLLVALMFLTPMRREFDLWIVVTIFACVFAPVIAAIVYSYRISPRAHSGASNGHQP